MANTAQLIDQWLDDLAEQGKSPYTLIAYRRGVAHFMRWSELTYGEDFDPQATLPRDLEHWKTQQLRVQKSAPATVNQRLIAVASFFGWAVTESILRQNPARTVKTIRLEKHPPRSLAPIQLNRLLRAVQRTGHLRDIAIIQVLVETGIRVGELLALRRGDLVDIQKRSAYLIVRQGKHGNYRTIPLTLAVREALTAYLTQPVQAILAEADPVWWGPKSPLTQASSILRLLDKYSLQAGIPKVSPHQLRHTFATRYLQRNPSDLRGLARLMGHSDLNTVMLYTEPSLDDLRQRMDLFDQPID